MTPETTNFPILRGRSIRTDDDGLVCLNDIHKAGGFSTNQTPAQWQRLPFVTGLIVALLDRIMGKSHDSKISTKSIIYANRGATGGTYADRRLALAYAEYLSPKLALEVKEVFLRYMDADPTLADEVLQRATPEANEWVGTRALSRSVRHQYTEVLRDHGAVGPDYGICTNVLYRTLFDKTAAELKESKGLPAKSAKLRDAMTSPELVFVMAGETLSSERIEEEDCRGGPALRAATSKSARRIRDAIDADRRDRRGPQQGLF